MFILEENILKAKILGYLHKINNLILLLQFNILHILHTLNILIFFAFYINFIILFLPGLLREVVDLELLLELLEDSALLRLQGVVGRGVVQPRLKDR